jgi:opacity protein-like surface antigen
MRKFLMAAATAAALACAAPAAQAATTFTLIDQTSLDTVGTSNFGAIIDSAGAFNHTFNFTTSDAKNASSSVITIFLGGAWDVDFSSVDLDGVAFTKQTNDPAESWALNGTLLGAGPHTINLHGTVTATTQSNAGSYAGTLNIANVPEPATWALMISGFGAAGAMLRRKRALALV